MYLTKVNLCDDFRVKGANKRMAFRTANLVHFELPAMNFVENFVLVLHWNASRPSESVVEVRCRFRSDTFLSSRPIDPNLLRKIVSDAPRYRDAIVDLAPGRSFIKGLCGTWVESLDTYAERAADSLAGGLLQDKALALAMGLSFPGKVKGLSEGNRVYDLLGLVSRFKVEEDGYGPTMMEIGEFKKLMAKCQKKIEDTDSGAAADMETFEQCSAQLARYGIVYDFDEPNMERGT